MFESDFIDGFSRVPFWVVPLVWFPLIGGFLAWGIGHEGVPWSVAVGHFVFGWFVWSLLEYVLHRTLFHWTPPTSWGPRFHFLLHGVHHEWHQDRYRLVMPPPAAMAIGAFVFAGVFLLGKGLSPWLDPHWVWTVFAGVMAGYVGYDLTHYYIHHGRPRSKVFKKLRAHHLAHHHNPKFQDRKYGVSSTLWDHVFGTY